MKTPKPKTPAVTDDPERCLAGFIDKFEPDRQDLIRAVRKALCKRLPTAYEMVYDNYNFFVIGYSSTERPSDAILSIAAGANGVSLCLIHGAHLPDPGGVLQGGGSQTRFIRLDSAKDLAKPTIATLIDAAVAQAKAPMRAKGESVLVIRSVSAKQRPRRKPPAKDESAAAIMPVTARDMA